MTAKFDEQVEIRLLHSRLRRFAHQADRPDPIFIWKLGECAETRAATRLLRLFLKAVRSSSPDVSPKESAGRVLDALETILDALLEYRAGDKKTQGRLFGQLRKLKRARSKDWADLLRTMTANPEHAPELYSALWREAYDLGARRQSGRGQNGTVKVLVDKVWIAGTAQCSWEVLLTRDDQRFLQIVDQAIAANRPFRHSFDYLRRLRDLAKKPSEVRLRNFIRDAAAADQNGMDVAGTGFAYAGRRTKIFPDGLPSDWVEQVARKPKRIAQLALGFLDLIELKNEARGRTEDKAIALFADGVGSAFFHLTGKPIAYARGTETSRSALRGRSYGLGLEVMTAALQLVDSSLGASQAQTHITRIRGWDKPTD